MTRFRQLVIISFLIIIPVIAGIGFYLLTPQSTAPEPTTGIPVHFYRDPARSLDKIHLKVFYVVPKNRTAQIYPTWRELLSPVLEETAKFHEIQFHGLSKIQSDVFPEPLILEHDNIYYDTDSTNRGNPEALRRITPEVEERARGFLSSAADEFVVIGLIYEGVGASGSRGAFLLSRSFLSEEQYRPFRSSLLYHEFGHTMGLPDQYDLETGQHFSEDIMGSGRNRPLEVNYIDQALLEDLGVTVK